MIKEFVCVISVFRKYTWVIPLKDNAGITITNAFQKILEIKQIKYTTDQ